MILPELLILLFFAAVVLAVAYRRLHWVQRYPAYLLFITVAGLLDTWVSHGLVLAGYVTFPWRFLPGITLNNMLYDLLILPLFSLVIIEWALAEKRFWLPLLFYAGVITAQDWLAIHYTRLLAFEKWTLFHSAVSAAVFFAMLRQYFCWLCRHVR